MKKIFKIAFQKFPAEKWAQQQGLTLIEMMIALVIFSVGILGIIGLQATILVGNDFAGYNTVAKSLASERLNNLTFGAYNSPDMSICPVATPFCHADAASSVGAPPATGPGPAPMPGAAGAVMLDEQGRYQTALTARFVRDWDVQPGPAPFQATSKRVQVRVTWMDLNRTNGSALPGSTAGRQRSLVYTTVYTQP